MDWRAALFTFGLVFFAELGDKTQLTTMMLASQSRSPLATFAGAALALVATSLLGVMFGQAVTNYIPARHIRTVAGLAFIVLGLFMVARR